MPSSIEHEKSFITSGPGLAMLSHWVWQQSFVEIYHEIFSMVILSLLLIQERLLSVFSERLCTILINSSED